MPARSTQTRSLSEAVGRYILAAQPTYRFRVRDDCFAVLANVGNTWTSIDAVKTFWARRGPAGWSLR